MKQKTGDPVLKKLIVGQMALQGVNARAIDFFCRVYDLINNEDGDRCKKMADKACVARPTAYKYIILLQNEGILERRSRNIWRLSKNSITDPDLRFLANIDRGLCFLSGVAA